MYMSPKYKEARGWKEYIISFNNNIKISLNIIFRQNLNYIKQSSNHLIKTLFPPNMEVMINAGDQSRWVCYPSNLLLWFINYPGSVKQLSYFFHFKIIILSWFNLIELIKFWSLITHIILLKRNYKSCH